MRTMISMACCILFVASSADEARAEGPLRRGFTGELGLGASMLAERAEDKVRFGVAPLSVGVGGFLNDDLALLLRWSGATSFRMEPQDGGEELVASFLGQVGPSLQYFAGDHLMLGLGAGVAVYTRDVDFSEVYTGFVGSARIGVAFWNGRSATLRISTEALPAIVFDGKPFFQYGQTLALEWQGF